jgi:D-glucosaminate-6-phosphate ammonia-lyase
LKNSSLTIMPYMMMPGDAKVAAERLYQVLKSPLGVKQWKPAPPAANVSGLWDVQMEYLVGKAKHTIMLEQKDNDLMGTHEGETLRGDLRGAIDGGDVRFRSGHRIEGTSLGYEFSGKVEGDTIRGVVDMGEYGKGQFTAKRHTYQTGRRRSG